VADPVQALLDALTLGDADLAKLAAFDIVTIHPSPAREVRLTAHQVGELADLLNLLFAERSGR
jgi:hypothetical protein